MNSFLPNDHAFDYFCMGQTDGTVRKSTYFDPSATIDLPAVLALNADRCRHLGVEARDIGLLKPGTYQDGNWWLEEFYKQPGRWTLSWHGADLLSETYLIFVDEYLLHVVRPLGERMMNRGMRRRLSGGSRIAVVSRSGILRHRDQGEFLLLSELPSNSEWSSDSLPSDDFRQSIKDGHFIDKKGGFKKPIFTSTESRQALVDLYGRVNDRLESELGYCIYVTHGTLLGLVRSGDFLPNDDDFDCAYLSRLTNCRDVSAERQIVQRLLDRDGMKCSLGSTGHLKIQTRTAQIDLMPAWFEDGHYNVGGYTSIPMTEQSILPLQSISLVGRQVLAPSRPQDFLAGNYGPGWLKPDPFYKSKLNSRVKQNRAMFLEDQTAGV